MEDRPDMEAGTCDSRNNQPQCGKPRQRLTYGFALALVFFGSVGRGPVQATMLFQALQHPSRTPKETNDVHADDQAEPERDPAEPAGEEPRTKTDLYKMFNKKGPTSMVANFMSSRELRDIACFLVIIGQPLENQYYRALEKVSGGWPEQADYVSCRAIGSWWSAVAETVLTVASPYLHDRLGLTRATRTAALPAYEWPQWAAEDLQLLSKATNFAVTLAANIMWSNSQYWMSLPQLLATVMHTDRRLRSAAMSHIRKLVRAIVAAESHKTESATFRDCMNDLAWNKQQLAREAMALLLQSEFRDGSSEIRKLARRLYLGTPSTKDILENTFAFMKRKSCASQANQKFNNYTKYLYAIASPYAETGGCPQVLPSSQDYATVLSPTGYDDRAWANQNLFAPQKTQLPKPDVLHRPQDIQASKWRTSGVLAQQRASAAAAYLMHDHTNKWVNIDHSWAG